ncbi:SPW repeat protein [Nocardioides sp. JQ2195]|uniref:SPW repeat protein n=1 Tax=Nocardioides sp. JQ2195 TaxID=2592334 RepID=UPI00143E9540|nr:SPW repeat protein [Nocardioides sp. JQ2195]QIX27161.1 SPW repeat protein [Nocardioides sp. JQ2195]
MKKWTRWQDWVALAAGVYALLSPIWTNTETRATWTMVVLGAAVAVVALWSLAMPGDQIADYALILMGVLLFISPWVMDFATRDNLAMTAWITGAITAVAGVLAMPQIEKRMHPHHRTITH